MVQCRLGGIARAADLALAALALGDLLGGDIDADDVAVRPALRMPVGDPAAILILARTLAVDLDAGHGIAGLHDRSHDGLDRVCQPRHAVAHRAPEMPLDRNPADLGEALVDLQIAAVWRGIAKAARRGVIDQL